MHPLSHVIEDATEIEVTSNKNKTYTAEVIGSDQSTDLAVLKIKTDESLPFIPFGDSELARIGEWVLAPILQYEPIQSPQKE